MKLLEYILFAMIAIVAIAMILLALMIPGPAQAQAYQSLGQCQVGMRVFNVTEPVCKALIDVRAQSIRLLQVGSGNPGELVRGQLAYCGQLMNRTFGPSSMAERFCRNAVFDFISNGATGNRY